MRSLYNFKKVSNLQVVVEYYLSMINAKHTSVFLHEAIDNHVESPSMLTLKDVLFDYGIESALNESNA